MQLTINYTNIQSISNYLTKLNASLLKASNFFTQQTCPKKKDFKEESKRILSRKQ